MHRVSIGPEASARGADEGDREAGSYEATHFRVRPLPFGGKAGGKPLRSSSGLSPLHPVHREHEWSEGTAPSQAERSVLGLLFLLVALEDLLRGSVAIRRGVRVGDSDIEDRRRASGPKSVDGDVAAEFWGGLGAVGPCYLHVLTGLD